MVADISLLILSPLPTLKKIQGKSDLDSSCQAQSPCYTELWRLSLQQTETGGDEEVVEPRTPRRRAVWYEQPPGTELCWAIRFYLFPMASLSKLLPRELLRLCQIRCQQCLALGHWGESLCWQAAAKRRCPLTHLCVQPTPGLYSERTSWNGIIQGFVPRFIVTSAIVPNFG